MKRSLLIGLFGLYGLGAGPVLAADLVSVYREALAHDASFAAARAQFEADQEKQVQGRAGLLPQIGFSADGGWNDTEVKTAAGTSSGDFTHRGFGVQLTQPLFRQQNWLQAKQGELLSALAGVQLSLEQQSLLLRVAEAYFNVLNAQDAVTVVGQLRTAASEQLELAKTSFEVGTVTITDVHEAQSRFDLASAQEIAAESQLEIARQQLALIVGHEPEALAGLRPGLVLEYPQPSELSAWVSAAQGDNLGVHARQLAQELAAREVERARAGHLPTVDLVASHGQRHKPQLGTRRNEATSIGVQLNVPLYTGGLVSSVSREAAALRLKADAELEDARRAAALATRQSWLGVTSGMAEVKALEAAERSSQSALEANKLGYEVGVRINIDVLNAQAQLADTLQKLSRARYDTLLAQLNLKAAAGTLDEADLAQVNALLEQD